MSDEPKPPGTEADHPILDVIVTYLNQIYRPPFTTLVREPGRVTFGEVLRDDDGGRRRFEIVVREIGVEPWAPKETDRDAA